MLPFPDAKLKPGPLADLILPIGLTSLHEAIDWIWRLPYGRNSDRANYLLIATEGKGACSTKHAFIAGLSAEQGIPLYLMVGLYMMNAQSTPRLATAFESAGIQEFPEAHCYLIHGSQRFDFTRYKRDAEPKLQTEMICEERIQPDQIGEYKIELHQKWMKSWISSQRDSQCSFDELWAFREKCIGLLGSSGSLETFEIRQ